MLAKRARISRTQIVKIEAGVYPPRFEEVVRLAEALGTPLQTFLTDSPRPNTTHAGIAIELTTRDTPERREA